ncbi:hypothetical protein GCM10009872_37990 [Actinopolymorpha rutila]
MLPGDDLTTLALVHPDQVVTVVDELAGGTHLRPPQSPQNADQDPGDTGQHDAEGRQRDARHHEHNTKGAGHDGASPRSADRRRDDHNGEIVPGRSVVHKTDYAVRLFAAYCRRS